MQTLKKSVGKLIHRNTNHQFDLELTDDDFFTPEQQITYEPSFVKPNLKSESVLPLNNPHREKELLDSIEQVYFEETDFDTGCYEIEKLEESLDINVINKRLKTMKQQMAVATRKIFNFILENYPSYSAELVKVTELQLSIQNAFNVCHKSRQHLSRSESVLTVAGLASISKFRRKQRLVRTLAVLAQIKTMQATDMKIRQMIEANEVVNAIQLCLECQKATDVLQSFECIRDLKIKLQRTLCDVEAYLNNSLISCIINFDPERYNGLFMAYCLLGKINEYDTLICQNTKLAIDSTSCSVIKTFFHSTLQSANTETDEPFIDLCRNIDSEKFVQCFKELVRFMWQILRSFTNLINWHMEREKSPSDKEESVRLDLSKILSQYFPDLWTQIAEKIDNLITSVPDTNTIKFGQFVEFLKISQNFIKLVNSNFAQLNTQNLDESVKQLSLNYFEWHHKGSLYELKQFLLIEQWTVVPASFQFSWQDLHEFRFTKIDNKIDDTDNDPFSADEDVEESDGKELVTLGAVDNDGDDVTSQGVQSDEDFNDNSRSLEPMKSSFKPVDKLPPCLCNSSLNLLRLIGRCLEVASLYPIISFEVVSMMTQLFEYYLFRIYETFVREHDYNLLGLQILTPKLKYALEQLRGQFGTDSLNNYDFGETSGSSFNEQRSSRDTFDEDFIKRIIAVESLISIAKQLIDLKRLIDSLLPKQRLTFSHQFFTLMIDCVPDFRPAIYAQLCAQYFDSSIILGAIETTSWDVTELMSQQNAYVDQILNNLVSFIKYISEQNEKCTISKEAFLGLKTTWIRIMMRVLVEGFSSIKKCTSEGRALMQLDFQHLSIQVEKMTNIKPLPDKDYVDNYIKAYYLPESVFEEKIVQNKWSEYSVRHLVNLINVTSHLSKKSRLKLVNLLENSENNQILVR